MLYHKFQIAQQGWGKYKTKVENEPFATIVNLVDVCS